MTKVSREIKAVSLSARALRCPDDEDTVSNADVSEDGDDVFRPTGLFSFDAWNRKNPLVYKPNVKMTFFKHAGRYFQWSTSTCSNVYGQGNDQLIIIRCPGRDTKPIKQFLEYVNGWTHEKQVAKPTHVYRTSSRINGGERGQWTRVAVRPPRSLSTVALDDAQKGMIVRDINVYLHPTTARCFSLAGIFGLQIYCVALGEMGLTEAILGSLFADLPERCIVLLEDIDSAGLTRGGETVVKVDGGQDRGQNGGRDDGLDDKPDDTDQEGNKSQTKSHKKGSKNIKGSTGGNSPGFISLAGLLNVIDGAASQKGRVLIMTTNYPEKLDSAFIRPGRVDTQIGFTLATRTQIRDIFKRMYNTALDTRRNTKGKDAIIEGAVVASFTTGGLSASAEEK
ncbi:hypothetical protein DE146DRAFT_749864 [Phaeosphaeria sp. MPI-PUGE-AT-0046c]|nr:hypothetical protein DE146DRAFT_749864 [Phaeosphaeria sp. MPI-PUGE-AT-0046c]